MIATLLLAIALTVGVAGVCMMAGSWLLTVLGFSAEESIKKHIHIHPHARPYIDAR